MSEDKTLSRKKQIIHIILERKELKEKVISRKGTGKFKTVLKEKK